MNHPSTCRLLRALVVAVGAWALAACGSPASGPAPGILQVGHKGELNGVHYLLEANFEVTGTETLALDLGYTDTAIAQDLAPGAYAIEIQPGFRVLQDAAVAEVPVASELSSAPSQAFQIVSGAATLVSYQFAVDGGTVSFNAD